METGENCELIGCSIYTFIASMFSNTSKTVIYSERTKKSHRHSPVFAFLSFCGQMCFQRHPSNVRNRPVKQKQITFFHQQYYKVKFRRAAGGGRGNGVQMAFCMTKFIYDSKVDDEKRLTNDLNKLRMELNEVYTRDTKRER